MRIENKYTLIWNDETKQIIFADFIENADVSTGERIETFETLEAMNLFINENNLLNDAQTQ